MKEYLIRSEHYIYELNEDGSEGRKINYYEMSSEIKGNTVEEAIKDYIENVLFFTYNKEHFEIGLNRENEIIFSNTVDENNVEDENGKYSSINFIYVNELKKVNLEKELK